MFGAKSGLLESLATRSHKSFERTLGEVALCASEQASQVSELKVVDVVAIEPDADKSAE